MNKPWNVVKLLESNNSRLHKESVIESEMLANNVELFEGIRLCMDSLITFGIKKVPEKLSSSDDSEFLQWDDFTLLVGDLVTRSITGNAAAELINDMMKRSAYDQWNYWYRRILIKDLRCGVSEKTINKVAEKLGKEEYSVPVLQCQLASPSDDHAKKMKGKKLIDVKMDGARVLSILHPTGEVEQFSRNGKILDNFDTIREQLKHYCSLIVNPIVLDGEVMSSSFQDLMKQMHRKEDIRTDDATLNLFDIIPLSAFIEEEYKVSQLERSHHLDVFIDKVPRSQRPNINVIDREMIDLSTLEGNDRLKEINDLALKGGYEGIMIKDPNGFYECKRATNWLKMKPFITVDLQVVGYEEGTGKNQGKLGALICEGRDDGRLIKTNVGSGLTDADRKLFWDCREDLVGRTVEIKADAITKSQDSEDEYSLRFPVFMHFRGDK